MKKLKLVGLCGSLRKSSFNRMLLQQALASLPADAQGDVLEWSDVPPFNGDVLDHQGFPAAVLSLRERIREADGVVIASPEYNFSIPGVFKNVFDWISRGTDQPLAQKPVALLSATTGPLGGARVQYDFRRVLLFMNAMVLQKPEIYVGNAGQKFSADGACVDDTTRRFLTEQMSAFKLWIEGVQRMRAPD